ncbi:T9SS-dependent choice-of-anchor J family protein [Flavobacterium sp. UBA6135]|uniref:T9SS-dependent choice-of-anchor J family protein n=1 Tax=Flavobacterium sp. UBA6135 TaxID=1946553 RepID=UPI0025BEF7D4|nr:choice-of-anchor J domain-containing protein [Flavobacterium sp. UBA6135]
MKKLLLFSLICIPMLSSSQVFQSGFETVNGPLSQWTLYNQDNLVPNASVNFVNAAWVQTPEEFDNNIAMSNSYYTPAGIANDWMVSPQISIPAGTSTLYWHARAYDATYPDAYRVYVSTSGNTPANFTTPLLTIGNGTTTGENTTWTNRSLDLSSFAGQNVYIAFQNFSNDMFLLGIDNVYVTSGTCPAPGRLMTNSNITLTSGTFNWTAATGITEYDYSWGAPGHTPSVSGSVTGTSHSVTSLTANSRYQYFVRSKNGATTGAWVGPYSLFTAVAGAPSYSYGFDTVDGGYRADGWSGAWSTNATAGNPQAGSQMVFSNSSTVVGTPTNRWLFSKPIYLEANSTNTITFYLRNFGAVNPQSIKMTVGNEATIAAQSNTLWTSSTISNIAWTQYTVSYTPTTTGVHYFGFHHFTPGAAGAVSLGLDTFNLTSVLSVNEFVDSNFTLYPNPTTDFFVLKAISNSVINKVILTDIKGSVIKEVSFNSVMEAQLSISELNSGMYFVTIYSDNGSGTTKIIKN